MDYLTKEYHTMQVSVNDHIAVVRFNRPEAMNAANVEMSYERLEIYSGLSKDEDVRVVIITGDEKAYCAGGDLAAFSKFDVDQAQTFGERGVEYQRLLMDMPKPTIAAVAGYAFGGGMENVLLCDLRIAADNAKFALPEINVGIFPGGGGTQRLVQNVSVCRAKELIYFGKTIDAQTALNMGLLNAIVPLSELMKTAMEWAEKLCKKSPISLEKAKSAINAAWNVDIYKGMEMETLAWASMYSTQDQKEGMEAFLQKRKPTFIGK
jgi:enoyl-CoA hydratase